MKLYLSYRVQKTEQKPDGSWLWEKCREEKCLQCGKPHDSLWTINRKCVAMMGHFPVFRINGEENVLDLSLPHTVDRLPRDAVQIEDRAEFARLWHTDTGSHVFG